jgi:hypothetical protein
MVEMETLMNLMLAMVYASGLRLVISNTVA